MGTGSLLPGVQQMGMALITYAHPWLMLKKE
jgi:hypothetical protein